MLSSAWVSLFRLIPSEQYTNLLLTTTNGTEIYVQGVYRLETDYLVVRGRLGGSTDAGKVLIIPFDQVHFIGFRDEVKEAAVQAMFQDQKTSNGQPSNSLPTPVAVVNGESPVEDKRVVTGSLPARAGNPGSLLPGKAALLERLRRARALQDTPPGK